MIPKILLAANRNKEFYIDAVNSCGAEAHAVYCPEASTDYDGLILCGGNDIDPKYYGEEINGAINIDEARDTAEVELARAFIAAGKPILGICRGSQLLNILFGGSLYQNLENAEEHKPLDDKGNYRVHEVKVEFGSILFDLYGEKFSVNSAHHQAVKKLGEGLVATAFSDGIVEAFEHKNMPIMGVQFHPEKMCCSERRSDTVDGIEIFKYFINSIVKDNSKTQGNI